MLGCQAALGRGRTKGGLVRPLSSRRGRLCFAVGADAEAVVIAIGEDVLFELVPVGLVRTYAGPRATRVCPPDSDCGGWCALIARTARMR